MGEKTVLVLFKTHLDLGFTDFAGNVAERCLHTFIPNAIRVGRALKDTDTPFRWTVGSWMLEQALKHDADGQVEQAVRDGVLNWHGLPFTTHTELMSPRLFQIGLDISKRLDERFGRSTTGAKLTDVPGHTIGMVPLMARAGLKFLHIGVNPATPVPPVPQLFRWRCGGEELTVMYQGEYGDLMDLGDFAVCFAHTGDNQGPQSAEEIAAVYAELRQRYPGCRLQAATLNDLAERVCAIPNLPVLENEIGDTWIHGAATDPGKISRYRRCLRALETSRINGEELTSNLLLVPEHTWGMDVKTFFRDESHYTHGELAQVATEVKTIEASWQEQRDYVTRAEEILHLPPETPLQTPNVCGFRPAEAKPPVEVVWQIFGREDYERYQRDYLRLTKENTWWALWDFTKVGLKEERGAVYTAHLEGAWEKAGERLFRLTFPADAAEKWGLPSLWLRIRGEHISLSWFGKQKSRIPQACYLRFTELGEGWELNKMGRWIIPEEVVGSPLLSAVDEGVRNADWSLETLDAPLTAPFGRKLLHYGEGRAPQCLHFILYNNIWNTNFPQWYDEDARFRFVLRKREAAAHPEGEMPEPSGSDSL